jgi:hypothetical protein
MCENENSLYEIGEYFDLNVHFVIENRCIMFRNCATESCFKYSMHYYLYVFYFSDNLNKEMSCYGLQSGWQWTGQMEFDSCRWQDFFLLPYPE